MNQDCRDLVAEYCVGSPESFVLLRRLRSSAWVSAAAAAVSVAHGVTGTSSPGSAPAQGALVNAAIDNRRELVDSATMASCVLRMVFIARSEVLRRAVLPCIPPPRVVDAQTGSSVLESLAILSTAWAGSDRVARSLAAHPQLRRLALPSLPLGDSALATVVVGAPQLEVLSVPQTTQVTDDGFAALGRLSRLRALEVDVSLMRTHDAAAVLRPLETLVLHGLNKNNIVAVETLAASLTPVVRCLVLNMHSELVGDDAIDFISALPPSTQRLTRQLRYFRLNTKHHWPRLNTAPHAILFGSDEPCSELRQFSIDTGICNDTSPLKTCPKLKVFSFNPHLSASAASDGDMAAIPQHGHQLQTLKLHGGLIGERDLLELSPPPELRSLSLHLTSVRTLQWLRCHPRWGFLEELQLVHSNMQLTEADFETLAAVLGKTLLKLTWIHLIFALGATEAPPGLFAAMSRLTELQSLECHSTAPEADVAHLLRSLPKLRTYAGPWYLRSSIAAVLSHEPPALQQARVLLCCPNSDALHVEQEFVTHLPVLHDVDLSGGGRHELALPQLQALERLRETTTSLERLDALADVTASIDVQANDPVDLLFGEDS